MVKPDLLQRLCSASRRLLLDPYTTFEWPDRLDPDAHWFVAPSLSSLHGTPIWDTLAPEQQRRLSFFELVNLFSLAIAGERLLVHKMARFLYHPDYAGHTAYLHHFLEEENRHMVWFGTFCERYAGKVYPSRWYPLPAELDETEEEFRFWVSVLAFEEVGDAYNRGIAADDRVHPLSRAINRAHHREEARHLAYGRLMVRELWERYSPGWSPQVKERVQAYVAHYLVSQYLDFFNPAAYRDAGLEDPYGVRAAVVGGDAAQQRFRLATAACTDLLVDAGVLPAAPAFVLD